MYKLRVTEEFELEVILPRDASVPIHSQQRRNRISSASAAVTVHDMDVMAELTRMYLQRVTEVFAFEVIQPHPC
ncbi:hypothetical protein GCM10009410_36490 [Shewanella ulleungensis]|uniref:Uncharacterized protein n=1 Tax=Shewanella ulleungensis TaxID=2282699 RepID=A0ABQ2QYD3_9GAMM|nr:hypothetical protein GCM10009410_36490 [Shewanella ulleungensis]